MFPHILVLSLLPILALAQDGSLLGPVTSSGALGYFCDPVKCQLPDCKCASTSPPGGLHPVRTSPTFTKARLSRLLHLVLTSIMRVLAQSEVPQFIVFTADDAIQSYTLDAVNQFLAHRRNPNGCSIKMTYFTSLSYTNYTMVTGELHPYVSNLPSIAHCRIDWYVAGNEIADHT